MRRLKRQLGLSLVEILVALVISLFLLAGIVQVYTGNRATFSFTSALAEIQENGRYALDLITQDLRLANNWGCVVPTSGNMNDTLNAGTVPGYDSDFHDFLNEDPIEGTNNNPNGTDTLRIRGGVGRSANVESPFFPGTTQRLTINGRSSISAGDIVFIARCGEFDQGLGVAEADIHRVTAATLINGNTQTELTLAANKSQQFTNDAIVVELQTTTYSIAAGASGEPALFRQEFNAAAQELVEGIEDLQVLYGVDDDSDGFPNQYLDADNVVNFDDVVAVRVMLLVRSIDDFVTDAPQTYTFNGAPPVTAPDRRIRQVFTTTIALRNQLGSI